MGRDTGCEESSSAGVHLHGQDRELSRGSTGTNRSKHPLGTNPLVALEKPRCRQHPGRITAGHFFPTPQNSSPACGVFGVFQAGQHCSASSHRGR